MSMHERRWKDHPLDKGVLSPVSLCLLMGQVVEFKELHRARRSRAEKVTNEQCTELLEWNLQYSVDRYLSSPRRERPLRATINLKLSEVLEYTLRLC